MFNYLNAKYNYLNLQQTLFYNINALQIRTIIFHIYKIFNIEELYQ